MPWTRPGGKAVMGGQLSLLTIYFSCLFFLELKRWRLLNLSETGRNGIAYSVRACDSYLSMEPGAVIGANVDNKVKDEIHAKRSWSRVRRKLCSLESQGQSGCGHLPASTPNSILPPIMWLLKAKRQGQWEWSSQTDMKRRRHITEQE